MKIAIHHSKGSFSDRWIEYCEAKSILYKIVDCYQNDIIEQLKDCQVLMWHFHHANEKDTLFSKQLLYAVKASGRKIFPDFNTVWHFDDKVGQKYLMESMNVPLVQSYVFYSKSDAFVWAKSASFPKVFKLRGGAGSVNVSLVKSSLEAIRLIDQAFSKGFKHDSLMPIGEIYKKYRKGKYPFSTVLKRLLRGFIPSKFSRVNGNEIGYIYFQDFIPNNDHDIRVIVIGKKAFAIMRMVRDNDFRASGSGNVFYARELFNEVTIRLSFEIADRLKSQCLALDYVFYNEKPMVLEISYGFFMPVYEPCTGYWDTEMKWHEGKFNPYGWMIEEIMRE